MAGHAYLAGLALHREVHVDSRPNKVAQVARTSVVTLDGVPLSWKASKQSFFAGGTV